MARPQESDTQAAIEAAMAVVWERGLHRTSVDDLLAGSGLARSSLYNSFGGKPSDRASTPPDPASLGVEERNLPVGHRNPAV